MGLSALLLKLLICLNLVYSKESIMQVVLRPKETSLNIPLKKNFKKKIYFIEVDNHRSNN